MHTLPKIKVFRCILWITYPIALLFLLPIVLLRKKKNSRYFFLFDRYELGGAQRVHIDILQSIPEENKQVYFTRHSRNTLLQNEFYSLPATQCADIHFWCDNLLLRIFSIHFFAFYINRHVGAQVFSSNSTYFYDMLPFLNSKIRKTELLHNFTYGKKGMEFFGLANYKYLNARLCVDHYTAQNIKNQYQEYDIPPVYNERIQVIEPGVEVPATYSKDISKPLIFLYAGRGGPQKRIHLLDKIAQQCIKEALPIKFYFAGDVEDELSEVVKTNSILFGRVDKHKMNELYSRAHAIIMTSAFEGFPMLVKEGMAHGCIPLVTALEGNKTHLKDHLNALLIHEINDEVVLVSECMEQIKFMISNLEDTRQLSLNAYHYAQKHFDRNEFIKSYHTLLLSSTTDIH